MCVCLYVCEKRARGRERERETEYLNDVIIMSISVACLCTVPACMYVCVCGEKEGGREKNVEGERDRQTQAGRQASRQADRVPASRYVDCILTEQNYFHRKKSRIPNIIVRFSRIT